MLINDLRLTIKFLDKLCIPYSIIDGAGDDCWGHQLLIMDVLCLAFDSKNKFLEAQPV
jgi:Na+/glutamate symporter